MEWKWRGLTRSLLPITAEAAVQVERRSATGQALAPERQLPMISIIIPAHNEEAYIGQTLRSMGALSYPRYETIVVANACSDRTAAIAREDCDRLMVLSQRGISRARNAGARAARGKILLFLDADTLLEPDALDVIAEEFTRDYSAGTLKGKPDSEQLGFRLLYGVKNLMHRSTVHKGSIGVILCWKDQFEAAGGFDEKLHVMENSELIRKLGANGKYLCISRTSATTSMRRYQKTGFWKTTKLWWKLWLQSHWFDLRDKPYTPVR